MCTAGSAGGSAVPEEKRVLWLTPDKPTDISVGRRRIADRLKERGFDVTLRGTTFQTLIQSLRERGDYDVIVGTTRAGAFAGLVTKFVHGRPLVVDHVDPIRQFEETHPRWLATLVRALENISFRLADVVFYVYDEESERINRRACNAEQTSLGLEYDRFATPSDDAVETAARELENLAMTEDVVIYVGGLEPIYNVETLLDAVELLDDWTLLVLGDGSLSNRVQQASSERSDVMYLGTVPHEVVPGYLVLADVGISLVDDPHTLKTLEYAAAGLPVVQTTGRAEERFGDAFIYCDLNPESVASAIEEAGSVGISEELRELVREYDWSRIAERYAAGLNSAIE